MASKTAHNKRDTNMLLIVPRVSLSEEPNFIYFFPMGLAYIVSVLKKNNYDVDVINLNHKKGNVNNLVHNELNKKKYDIVLTGGIALFFSTIEAILKSVRSHPSNPKLILGGLLLTSEKEFISKNLDFDYGVIGEGEETIIELLKCIENKKDLNSVKGIVYFKDKGPVFTENRQSPMDLDKIPFPDVEALGYNEWLDNQIPNKSYLYSLFDKPRIYDFVGSRSCPYQCTFCYHFDSKFRQRSINNIFKEIHEVVKKYKINVLYLYDECFAIDKKRVKEFCDGLSELRKEIDWDIKWVPNFRADFVDDEILDMIKKAGCDIVAYGFESYSQEVLTSMNKNITPEQIDLAFKKTLSKGMTVLANFILGDIAETIETANETLDFWKNHCKGQVNLDFVRPYPNSKLYQYCLKEGIIKDKLKFMRDLIKEDDFAINMSKKMSDKNFKKLKIKVLNYRAKYLRFTTPILKEKTSRGIFRLTVKCPFCKEKITYENCHISNINNFSFTTRCRKCPMIFYIASPLVKIALKNYRFAKIIQRVHKRIINTIREQKL